MKNHFRSKLPIINGVFTGCSSNKSFLVRLYLPFTEPIIAYHSCAVNECVALLNRHLIQSPITPRLRGVTYRAFQRFRMCYPPVLLDSISAEQVVATKKATKRKTYIHAYKQYMFRGIISRDVNISMFVKYERMSIRDPLKPPRAIQARGPVFNLVTQKYIIPYAKHLVRSISLQKRFVTKGMDAFEVADLIHRSWMSFKRPVALLLDHDRFDSRANSLWTSRMHHYISDHFRDHEVVGLLCRLHKSKARTLSGISYTTDNCVFSGDVTTSDGNSTINKALLVDLMWGVKHVAILNGDDSVVVFELDDLQLVLSRDLSVYEFKTKSNVVYEFTDIEYCQCQPVLTISGWMMVRNPLRVISRSTTCLSPPSYDYLVAWFASVGECEYSCSRGVPVLSSFSRFMMRASSNRVALHHEMEFHRVKRPTIDTITADARNTFAMAFRLSPCVQLQYEAYFDNLRWGFDLKNSYYPTPPMLTVPYF